MTRIEDLWRGDFATVDCAACHHVALLAPEFLARLGLSPPDQGARTSKSGCGVAAARQSSRPAAPRMSAPVHPEATRSGSTRHLCRSGEPAPVPYLAPEVVHDAQVAWNALARLELLLGMLPVPAPDCGRIDVI